MHTIGNFESPINLTAWTTDLWMVGENWSTRRNPTQAQGEHAKLHTEKPRRSSFEPVRLADRSNNHSTTAPPVLMMPLRIEMLFVNRSSDRITIRGIHLSHINTRCLHKFNLPAVELGKHDFQPFIHAHSHKRAHFNRQMYSHTSSFPHLRATLKMSGLLR